MRMRWLLVDAIALLLFTVLGVYHHHSGIPSAGYLFRVFAPFAIGWFVMGLLTGLYRPTPPPYAYPLTWLIGVSAGVLAYSWVVMEREVSLAMVSPAFWTLSLLFMGLLTGGARFTVWAVNRRRARLSGG